MLQARLRPLPRRQTPIPLHSSSFSSSPLPDLRDEDGQDVDEDESPEDLFGAFLPHLFPDDAPSFHGDPGQHLLYCSPHYGDLEIMVPSYPSQSEKPSQETTALPKEDDGQVNHMEVGRKLFAHFLWSAAMVVAEGVEKAAVERQRHPNEAEELGVWAVKGEKVLELGAGAALPSLVCALAGASAVTITDHPSSPAFAGAISFNMEHNYTKRANFPTDTKATITIQPHEWGVLDDAFAIQNKGTFTRIIAADCFWMRSQHENLVRTMLWFLAPSSSSSGDDDATSHQGRIWVVTGFHTGRAIVAGFFETAVQMGLEIERIYERDLNSTTEDGGEVRREWVPVREGEGPENRRRWCVIAVLKRREKGNDAV